MSFYRHTPFAGALDDLPRYVNQELSRLAASFELDAGAATLFRAEPEATGIEIDTIPAVISSFTDFSPIRYLKNCEPSLSEQAIFTQRGGIWAVTFTITAEIQQNRSYRVEVYADEQPTDLLALVDPSNQTDIVTLVATGTRRTDRAIAQRGSRLDLRVSADGPNADWRVIASYFNVWWCAD